MRRRSVLAGSLAALLPASSSAAALLAGPGGGGAGPPGADTPITALTTTEARGRAATNEIISIPIPTHATAVPAGTHLRLFDDNGSGGKGAVLANFQVDNIRTIGGAQRLATVTGVLPSIGARATRKLSVHASSTAPPSGTAITLADLRATAFRVLVSLDIGGTTYTADTNDMLAASTSFSKTAAWLSPSNFRSGPCCTQWTMRTPLMREGRPHNNGNGLHVEIDVAAYKAGTAAVGGGNPIIRVDFDLVIENADLERVAGDVAHYYYGLKVERSTSLTVGTLISSDATDPDGGTIRYAYPRSTPAARLTFAGFTYAQTSGATSHTWVSGTSTRLPGNYVGAGYYAVNKSVQAVGATTGKITGNIAAMTFDPGSNTTTLTYVWNSGSLAREALTFSVQSGTCTATLSAGTWATDIVGAHLVSLGGAGKVVVVSKTSGTACNAYMYEFASAGSYGPGDWAVEGIGHHYNTPVRRKGWVGAAPSSLTVWGNAGSAVTPTSNAPLAYLAASKLLLNFQTTLASVAHNMAGLNLMRAADKSIRPLTLLGPDGIRMGDVATDLGGTGGRPDLYHLPQWVVQGLAKCDPDGRRKIFENAEYFATWQYLAPKRLSGAPAAGALPCPPRVDNGTSYKWNPAFPGTQINAPKNWWPFETDIAHQPACFYVPYLLTGERFWLNRQQALCAYTADIAYNAGYNSPSNLYAGQNKTPFGDATHASRTHFGTSQTRAVAWSVRDTLMALAITPDDARDSLFNAAAYYDSWLPKFWLAAKAYGPDDVLGVYGATEPLFVCESGQFSGLNGYLLTIEAPWMVNFHHLELGMAHEIGIADASFTAVRDWFARSVVQMFSAQGIVPDIMATAYRWFLRDNDGNTAYPKDWATVYQRGALNAARSPSELSNYARIPIGSLTLSDVTVGSARTFTFSNNYFASGSWYLGGYISDTSGGLAKITGVSNKILTCDIKVAFRSITPTIGNVRIPGPHPKDYDGYAKNLSSVAYRQIFANAARLLTDQGVPGAAAALAWILARPGYSEYDPYMYINTR